MTNLLVWFAVHPDVAAVSLFLGALGAHVAVGGLLHLFRLHDFDWRKLGQFVEHDLAVARGIAIGVTFLLDVITRLAGAQPNASAADIRLLIMPAVISLCAACAASILPIVRDTLYELVQLLSGWNPNPALRARTRLA